MAANHTSVTDMMGRFTAEAAREYWNGARFGRLGELAATEPADAEILCPRRVPPSALYRR
jgi:hypothetical protein